jgi:Protein of unknown function (DUF2857)
MTISLQSPDAKANGLLALVQRIDAGEIESLLKAGFDSETLELLRNVTSTELSRLSNMHTLKMSVGILPTDLNRAIRQLKTSAVYDNELAYFVQHGATLSMLRKYFVGDAKQIDHLRSLLSAQDVSQKRGRATMPNDESLRDDIHRAWLQIKKKRSENQQKQNLHLRDELISLHGQFNDLRLDVLYAVINEFGDF